MTAHHIENPKVAARIESLMARLREAYPDGVVTSLQKEHKGLANKLGEA